MTSEAKLETLLREVRACRVCADTLPLGPRPVVRGHLAARIMIISQAPGTKVHATGLSFNDRSGDVLRAWLGIDRESFYEECQIAIVPMGFCYPGRDKGGGDLPPRKECAPLWQARLAAAYANVRLKILAGSYAINWHLAGRTKATMGETVKAWRDYLPEYVVLPHPSWRNVLWVRKNPWFEAELLPELRARVGEVLTRVEGEPPRHQDTKKKNALRAS
jgi:uracil-DNA glycosylase